MRCHTQVNAKNDPFLTIGFVGGAKEFCSVLSPIANKRGIEFRDYPGGRSVLRRAAEQNAIWLIDIELPDMSGLDLYDMIHERLRGSAVCMIGTVYCQADEVRAHCAGATIYASRPVEAAWLQRCVEFLLGEQKPHGVVGSDDPSSPDGGRTRRQNGKRTPIIL